MKTIKVASSAGTEYGHVPGHQYHDAKVRITRARSGRWTVTLRETWGSCQGHDEEHGRKTVMACARTLEDAVEQAQRKAEAADLHKSYTAQALSCAEAKAAAKEDEEASEQATIDSAIDLSEVSSEQLIAEIRSRGVTAGE
jgi:phosphoribosyl-ATP pyrophosphohydrolase